MMTDTKAMQAMAVKKRKKTVVRAKSGLTTTITQTSDAETGLTYYGARYLDSKYSRWISGGPALGELGIAVDENFVPDPASGVSLTIGIKGIPGPEVHATTRSETVTASTSIPEILQGMNEIKQEFENWVIDKILETIPY